MHSFCVTLMGLLAAAFATGMPTPANSKRWDTVVTGYISYFDGQSKTYCLSGVNSTTGIISATASACANASQRLIFTLNGTDTQPPNSIFITNTTQYLGLSAVSEDAANNATANLYSLVSAPLTPYNSTAVTSSSGFVETSVWNLTRDLVTDFSLQPSWVTPVGVTQEEGYCDALADNDETCSHFSFMHVVPTKAVIPTFTFVSLALGS